MVRLSLHPRSSRSFPHLCVIGLVLLALGAPTVALAQVETQESPQSGAQEQQSQPPDQTQDSTAAREITPAARSVTQQIDHTFATIVNYMAAGLFYPLGASEREYIEFSPSYYYRPAGAESDFQPLDAQRDQAITDVKYRTLDALGRLTQTLQSGTLDGQEVEYFAFAERSGKYVRDGDVFRKTLAREMLSDDQTLTGDDVSALAAERRLKLGDGDPAHILTERHGGAPVVVLWLSLGAVFFTVYLGFFNFRGFSHALQVVAGKYDNPDEPGEVTHLQALSSALSATVGLGNIAGVTIAMSMGGPGAFFWMLCCGFFGMSSKFVESTLGQKYRKVNELGEVRGGPMEYLKDGFAERGLAPIGIIAGFMFTVMCMLASFGGGNMFQANQAGQQILAMVQEGDREAIGDLEKKIDQADQDGDTQQVLALQAERAEIQDKMAGFQRVFLPVFGVIFAAMVGVVIIGGIKRIGAAAEKVVPAMCGMYLLACLYIIAVNYARVPEYVSLIFTEAFNPQAFGGGMVGVLILGVRRAAFSNEAGVGSAAIAHSAAKTEEPIREGTVALLGPFIDTIVVCSMTALVVLITGAWNNEGGLGEGLDGSALTSAAFASVIPWFSFVLTIAIVMFAYSTLISWSYYGEKCWETLFGRRSVMLYKLLFVIAVFVGSIANLGAVLDFSDMMILSMAFPNILGLLVLSPSVKRDLADYWRRYQAGEFKTYK